MEKRFIGFYTINYSFDQIFEEESSSNNTSLRFLVLQIKFQFSVTDIFVIPKYNTFCFGLINLNSPFIAEVC